MEKFLPQIGDKLYLRQFTGNCWIDEVKRPFTVVDVQPTKVIIQECKLIPPVYHCTGNPYMDRPDLEGQRVWFYDTVAESIEEDKLGRLEELTWHSRKGRWGTKGPDSSYPQYAIFGEWKHQPYLN